MTDNPSQTENDALTYDVVIVGAGPAGLSAAIHLKQQEALQGAPIRVCVLEKGAEVGAHILSGAIMDPKGLEMLFPDWKERGAPLFTPVTEDHFLLLFKRRHWSLPMPNSLHNAGCYVVSLAQVCRWLADQAIAWGVDLYPGFPVADMLYDADRVVGVRTQDQGREKDGTPGPQFQPGVSIYAKHVLLAEGCRGSLSERVMDRYHLRAASAPQTYGLGVKELWSVPTRADRAGCVYHTMGWPLDAHTYGGGFLYYLDAQTIAVGHVVGLDYRNPTLSPFEEFQRFKTHVALRSHLEGGTRIAYGARALNEGGIQSLPKMTAPGVTLLGCSAGLLNVARLKGSHLAMASGVLAAQTLYAHLTQGVPYTYEETIRHSWVYDELYAARNVRPGFSRAPFSGRWGGLIKAGIDQMVFRGQAPWTLSHGEPDHRTLQQRADIDPIVYPKPDGQVSFDLMSSVYLSGTGHREGQPCHLTLKDPDVPQQVNAPQFGGPESYYCPAGVYQYLQTSEEPPTLHIQSQNCVHCKTCDIKDPTQNIVWTVPESGGPKYPHM